MANLRKGTSFRDAVYVVDEDGDVVAVLDETSVPFSPAADVADATDTDDVVDQLNALLASLRTAGILA